MEKKKKFVLTAAGAGWELQTQDGRLPVGSTRSFRDSMSSTRLALRATTREDSPTYGKGIGASVEVGPLG